MNLDHYVDLSPLHWIENGICFIGKVRLRSLSQNAHTVKCFLEYFRTLHWYQKCT